MSSELSRSSRWVIRLAALAGSAALAVGTIEAAVRLSGRDAPLVWRPDRHAGWWHIPRATARWTIEGNGWVEINALGLRDVDRARVKPPGVYRVGVFGDSMTEGVQVNVDQIFTQQLEARLQARGLRVEVLNFGVNGYSALQGYLLYKHYGAAFDLDLVVHAVFTDNDVADGDLALSTGQHGAPVGTLNARGQLEVDYTPAIESVADYEREPIHTIRRASATYRMLSVMRSGREQADRLAAGKAQSGGVPRRYGLYAEPLDARWQRAWSLLEGILAAFSADVREAGRAFAVLHVPAGQVVDAAAWRLVLAEHRAMAAHQWRLEDPDRRLREVAARVGVPVLSALPYFRAHLGAEPLFFGRVGHLTPRGHAVMAAFLDRALDEAGLLAGARAGTE